jgi:MFS transporter, FHS family, glucose/mannose:H+ symporter
LAKARITASLFLTYAVFAVLLNSVGTVILQSQNAFGVTSNTAALLDGFKDIPIAVTSFVVASFLPRLGYRRGVAIGLALVSAACVAMRLANAFWMTQLLFATVGASFAVVKISVYSSVGLIARDGRDHAARISVLEGVFMLGVLGGGWLFSLFIDPLHPAAQGWLNVYWILAAGAAAAAALMLVSPLDESRAARPRATLRENFADAPKLLREPFMLAYLASAFFYVLIEQSLGTWLPTFDNKVLRLPPDVSVQIMSLFAGAIMLGRFAGGAVLGRMHWRTPLTVCVAAAAVVLLAALPMAAAVHGPAHGWADASLAAFLLPAIGLFLGPVYPTVNSVVLSALPTERHAAMTGLIVIFSALGGTLGSFVTGRLFGHVGGAAAFYLTLAPLALLAIGLTALKRSLDVRPALALGPPLAAE